MSVHVRGGGDGLRSLFHAFKAERYILCLVGSVYHFHDNGAVVTVGYGAGEESVPTLLAGYRLAVHKQWEHVCAAVLCIHLLHIVTYGLEHAHIVVPHHVGSPLPTVYVGKQRSVCSHAYNVGIALKVGP